MRPTIKALIWGMGGILIATALAAPAVADGVGVAGLATPPELIGGAGIVAVLLGLLRAQHGEIRAIFEAQQKREDARQAEAREQTNRLLTIYDRLLLTKFTEAE